MIDVPMARLIIAAGAGVGLVVWLTTAWLYGRMASWRPEEPADVTVPGMTPEETIASLVEGCRPMAAQLRLSRPSPTTLEVVQLGVAARFTARREGGATRLAVTIDDAALRRKFQLTMAILVTVVIPAVVFGLAAALWTFAAPSANQAVRWQSVQIVQIVHVLWPPFLCFFLWRRLREQAIGSATNLVALAGLPTPTESPRRFH